MANSLLFIHVPKTGGLSVNHFLRVGRGEVSKLSGPRHHATAAEFLEHVGQEAFDSATKFAVVRDPISRFLSACNHSRQVPNGPHIVRNIESGVSVGLPSALFQKQKDLLYIDGELAVDKLFRYEDDVPEALYEWLIDQGFDAERQPKFPHVNRRRRRRPIELTEMREKWVREYYACDYEAFGYE
jgi:hypothetical protein